MRGTRWEPRRVLCGTRADASASLVEYVVKYRRPGSVGAAALISEVVCHALLADLRVRTLDAALVMASPALSRLYVEKSLTEYPLLEGAHFGTRYRPDLEPADPRVWTLSFIVELAKWEGLGRAIEGGQSLEL